MLNLSVSRQRLLKNFFTKLKFSSGFEEDVGQRRCISHFHPLRINFTEMVTAASSDWDLALGAGQVLEVTRQFYE